MNQATDATDIDKIAGVRSNLSTVKLSIVRQHYCERHSRARATWGMLIAFSGRTVEESTLLQQYIKCMTTTTSKDEHFVSGYIHKL